MRAASGALPCAFYCMQPAQTRPLLGDAEHTSLITRKCAFGPWRLQAKIRWLPVLYWLKFWFQNQERVGAALSAAYGINNGALYAARDPFCGVDVKPTCSSEGNSTRRRSKASLRKRKSASAIATQNESEQRRRSQSRGASTRRAIHLASASALKHAPRPGGLRGRHL